ncbi:hypothetical protein ASE00_16930 [Sphingomonas sp. Root710]|uniref:hypothetical protein n=1 Tax=Sphingomonas sp. Root710 TaxID=1736594 RepID=UPI0006F9485A|nr:hypothetical protein [Sphingomonas sp. Root710]KRB80716.1 hypothetical protein ASE00_16930 [Sphingomonas sp. Root710]
MNRNLLATTLAGAVLAPMLLATMAQAEPKLGSRLIQRETRDTTRARDNGSAVRAAHRFAACLYLKRGASVRGLMTSLAPADQERYERSLSRQVDCNNSVTLSDGAVAEGLQITSSPDVMRGMYAEAILDTIKDDEALQPAPSQASYTREWFAITGRDPIVDEMAVCVADQNPAGIRALLATSAETPEELAAARALAPSLGPCLPQGATLKANRQGLRAALAEALFHRATAPALAATN